MSSTHRHLHLGMEFVRRAVMLRRTAFVLLACCLSVCFSTPLCAQDPGTSSGSAPQPQKEHEIKPIQTVDIVRAGLEPAYIAYPIGLYGLEPLVFESNVVAHFVVTQPKWPFALVLTPKVLVRMFSEESVPVKSPSYMPRVTATCGFSEKSSSPRSTPA